MDLVDRLSGRTWTRVGWAVGGVALVVLSLLVVDGVGDGRAADAGVCRGTTTDGCLTVAEGTADLQGSRRSRYTYEVDGLDFTLDRSDRRELGLDRGDPVEVEVRSHDGTVVVVESTAGRVELASRGWGQAGLAGLGLAGVLVLMAGALLPGRSERKARALAGTVVGLYLVGAPLILLDVPLVGALAAAAGGAVLGGLVGWTLVTPGDATDRGASRPRP